VSNVWGPSHTSTRHSERMNPAHSRLSGIPRKQTIQPSLPHRRNARALSPQYRDIRGTPTPPPYEDLYVADRTNPPYGRRENDRTLLLGALTVPRNIRTGQPHSALACSDHIVIRFSTIAPPSTFHRLLSRRFCRARCMIKPWRWKPRVMKQKQKHNAKGPTPKSALRLSQPPPTCFQPGALRLRAYSAIGALDTWLEGNRMPVSGLAQHA
jgi:hypothetical protein